jgi:hypothetical protein
MMIYKKLSLGLVAATMMATPVMAQSIYVEPGVTAYSYPNSAYGYGVRVAPGAGYYYGNRFHPGPRVGAFATAPWTDDSYSYGSYGLVERQW